jgi:hypothetical protein
MASMALAIGAMTDAAEWTRHLFIFNFFVDFTFVCTVAGLIHRFTMVRANAGNADI